MTSRGKFGSRLKPLPLKLEQRFVFDGAIAADAVKTIQAIVTPNATLAMDSFNGVSSAYALDAVTKYADLIAPTNVVDGNQASYRVTKDGVVGNWQADYITPQNDGTQDGHYQVDIKQIDSSGNESGVETIDFVLQSISPDTPHASIVNAQSGGLDNGYDTDLVSSDGIMQLASNAGEGTLIEYKISLNGQDGVWGSTYQAPATDGSADGIYNLQVRQTDIAGNVSAAQSIDFTLDSSLADPNQQVVVDTTSPLVATSSLDLSTGQVITQHSNEILFVDTTVAGYQTLINDSRSGVDIYLLDNNQNPWSQMTDVLSHYQNVSAVHIVSHGAAGEIIIGDKPYGVTQLDGFSAELATWQNHMNANADILLYGCDIASGDSGTALVNELHILTQENISASSDTTGASDLGGNWLLESHTGDFNTSSVFTDSIYQDYKYELNAGTFSAVTGSNVDTTGVTSGLIGAGKVIQFDPINITTSPTSSGQLIIRAYDVDYGLKDSSGNYYAIGNANSEWDGVYLKGPTDSNFQFIGYLNGTNNNWSYTTLDVKAILQTQGTGNYSIRIIPDDNGTQTQASNGGRWVVGTSLASFVLDGGAHTTVSMIALSEAGAVVNASVTPTSSGNFTIQFILLDPSGRGAAQVDYALAGLTANVTKSFSATLVTNTNFYAAWSNLPTGTYNLQATLIDSLGVVQDTKTYTYNNIQSGLTSTSAGARILISDLSPTSWTGSSSADVAHLATTLTTPTITGALSSKSSTGRTVTIKDGSTSLGTVYVKNTKFWSFAIPTSKALSVGTHTITASYVNSNNTYVSQNYILVIDSVYGIKPVITGLTSASWTGASSADIAKTATTNQNPTLIGTAGANERINVYDGSTLLGATQANSSGAWTFDVPPSTSLNNGTHAFSAKDSAFNITSVTYSLVIDATTPTTSVNNIHISADTGTFTTDFVTGTATQDISATLSTPLGAHEILQGVVGGQSITNITVATNVVTITTASAHGYSVLDTVDISASTNTVINGSFIITAVTSTTFQYADKVSNISSVADTGSVLKWSSISVASNSTDVSWTSQTLKTGYADSAQFTPWAIQFRVVNTGSTPSQLGRVASQTYQLLSASGVPVISSINAITSSSVKTNNTSPVIMGTADAGSLVSIYADTALLGKAAVDSSGNWTFTPLIAITENTYQITAKETVDLIGYTSSASTAKTLVIDTTGPTVAVTAISSDSGTSGDFITNDNTLTFSGTIESGSTISKVYLDSALISSSATNPTLTTWSYAYGTTISDGAHTVSVVGTDSAGNNTTDTHTFVEDTALPSFASASVNGTTLKINLGDGTGTGLANINPVASTFTVKNSTTTITVNSVSVDSATNSVTLGLATSLSGANVTVAYTKPGSGNVLQDIAGNGVASFTAQAVTDIAADTTAPTAPGAITLVSDSGVVGDNITSTSAPTVQVALSSTTSGTTAPVIGDVIKVYADSTSGTLLGSAYVTSITSGNRFVNVALSSLGADGTKKIVATETDAKGNVSSTSSSYTFTVDSIVPTISTATITGSSLVLTYADTNGIYSGKLPAKLDFAVLVNGVSTSVSSLSISGNQVTLNLSSTNAVIDTDVVSISYTPALTSGGSTTYPIQDAAGNSVSALSSFLVTNSTLPAPLTLTGASAGLIYDNGSSSSDLISNQGVLQVNGLENNGSNYVQYQLNSGSWVSLSPGVTQFTPGYTGNGSQTVVVRQASASGFYSATANIAFTLDTLAPNVPTLALNSDSGTSSTDAISNTGVVNVSGLESASGTSWQYSINAGLTWTAGSGTSVTLSGDGSKAIIVKETDVAGNTTNNSSSLGFVLDTALPSFASASVNGTTLKINLGDGTGTGLANINPVASTFTVKNSTTTITVNSVSVDSATNSVTLGLATSLSGANVTVAYTKPGSGNVLQDIAGNGVASFTAQAVTDIAADTTAPTAPGAITLVSDSGVVGDNITSTSAPTVQVALSSTTSGTTAPVIGDVIKVYADSTSGTLLGSAYVTSITSGNRFVNVALSSLGADGTKKIVATETDAKGNVSSTSSSYTFTVDSIVPTISTATITGSSLVLTYADTNGVYSGKVPAAGDYVVLVNGAITTVSAVAISGNNVTLTMANAVVDTDTISVSYTPGTNPLQDAAANFAVALSGISVSNLAAPAALIPTLNNDSGYLSTDLITNSGVINLASLALGNHAQYQLNSGSWITLDPDVTRFTPSYSGDGTQTVVVRQISASGVNGATATLSFTLDTTNPSTPTLSLNTDSGISSMDKITNSGVVKVSGLESASGTTWQYSVDAGVTWAVGTGSTASLSGDGSKTIIVKEMDVAGNVSSNSASLGFTLDAAPPVLSRAVAVNSVTIRVYLADTGGSGVDYQNPAPDKTAFVAYDNVTTFTGSINGTVLTVSRLDSGSVDNTLVLNGIGVTVGTTITSQISGVTGGAGTYRINNSQTVTSTSMGLGNTVAVTSLTEESTTNSVLLTTVSRAVRVEYAQPASNGLRDIAGNLMVTTDPPVVAPTVAAAAPTLSLLSASDSGVANDGTTNVLTPYIHVVFNGTGNSYPLAGDMVTLYLNPASLTVDSYGNVVSGSASIIGAATIATADLTRGYIDIQTSTLGSDGTKNIVAAIGDQISLSSTLSSNLGLTLDRTAPVFSSGTIIGNVSVGTSTATLNYIEAASGLLISNPPLASDYAVSIDGVAYTPTAVSFGTNKIILTLGFAVSDSVNATVSYIPNINSTLQVQDQAGNFAASLSSGALANNSTPATPYIALASGYDSGLSAVDKITNLDKMTISGYKVGSTVYYRIDSGSWVSLSNPNTASISFTPVGLGQGNHLVEVKQLSAANIESAIGSLNFTYDTVAPLVATDSSLMGDNKIKASEASSVNITGIAEAGSTVTISIADSAANANTDANTVTADSNGNWSTNFDLTATNSAATAFVDGNISILITATDIAGNNSIDTRTMVLDTAAPTLATASVAKDTLTLTYTESGSGMFATAPSASDFTVTKGVGNTSVTVSSVTVDAANHKVKLTLAAGITNADSNVLVTYTPGSDANAIQDIAGNLATALSAQAVTINSSDTTAPDAPTLSLISDTGRSASDKITNAIAPTIRVTLNGTAARAPVAGDTVAVFLGSTQITTYSLLQADINNVYADITLDSGSLGVDGSKSLTAQITDSANNTSDSSVALAITLDTAVSAPVVVSINGDSGRSGSDNITNTTDQTLSGTAEANSTVTVYQDGVALGTATANGSGAWTYHDTNTLLDAHNYSFTATATDVAGNNSGASSALVAHIDTAAPNAPVITGLSNDSGSSGSDGITKYTSLALSGTAEANSIVSITLGGNVIGSATTDSSGNWTYTDASKVNGNTYSYTATATDVAGNISGASSAFVAKVDTVAPSAPVVVSINGDSGRSGSDNITNVTDQTLSGTAEANSTVTVYQDGVALGAATANGSGDWTYHDTNTLLDAHNYSFTATATDVAGNTSGASSALVARIDTTVPNAPVITGLSNDSGSSGSDGITKNTSLALSGTAEANSIVNITLGGNVIGSATTDSSGNWTYTDASKVNGNTYSYTATATDVAGNISAASSAFVAKVDTVAPNLITAGVLDTTLTLTYTESGSGMFATAPSASDFTVTKGVGNTSV
ncbi:MAG: Ig-like domain-containing protein, partial [Betaproteobacteria bacterium]